MSTGLSDQSQRVPNMRCDGKDFDSSFNAQCDAHQGAVASSYSPARQRNPLDVLSDMSMTLYVEMGTWGPASTPEAKKSGLHLSLHINHWQTSY